MNIIKAGITAPIGFMAGAVSCGIKKSGKKDLALLFSRVPAGCAAMFTANKIKSGSVIVSMNSAKKGVSQAIIVNSGNANCCVGHREITDASKIVQVLEKALGIKKGLGLIASTGIIGRPLAVGKIINAIKDLTKDLSKANGIKFAKAIMTTDTTYKQIAVEVKIRGGIVKLAGAAKGSGMICPNMATMLAFFTTDACIDKPSLRSAFKEAISTSFNKITVDGDMSTNDTAFILANAMAGNRIIKKGGPDYAVFLSALKVIASELAKKIILDGEGATKFVEVVVKNASKLAGAEKIARHIAGSSLVKTMIAGGDPNWGRIAASIGSSGVDIDREKIDIYFDNVLVMRNGSGTDVSRKLLLNMFSQKEIKIVVDLKAGIQASRIWTCDLTEEYVRINAEYET